MATSSPVLKSCLHKVGPLPEYWVRSFFGQSALKDHNASGLIWPSKTMPATPWLKRCRRPESRFAVWALWVALNHLELDIPSAITQLEFQGEPKGSLGNLNGQRWGFSKHPKMDYSLRLGDRSNGWITPGPTLEEESIAAGVAVSGRTFTRLGAWDESNWEKDPYSTTSNRLGAILDLEIRRAHNWILAEPLLGLTCLMGPLNRRVFVNAPALRLRGDLNRDGSLSKLGWWRLAATSRQGVGRAERVRATHLIPGNRTWYHTRRIQGFMLQQWRNCGWLPLAVEYSEFSWELRRLAHVYRPDGLMVTPQGELVWYEYMRRPLRRINAIEAIKYIDLEKDYLPHLSMTIERPVRFVYQGPDIQKNLVIPIPRIQI